MVIKEYYEGKNVLITGTTGFLGKVILEKFLRCVPTINKIFILIRVKKGQHPMERFQKEVITSPLFERLRKTLKEDFENYLSQKVQLIQGDLLLDKLGISTQDRQLITEQVHVVINSAASVDFNAKLIDAININVLGTLKMFELCLECKNLENFIHVSTTYVNCDRRGYIEEDIYDPDQDSWQMVNQYLQMPADELEKNTKKILGPLPNTYVFTKGLVERILKKRKPSNMTLSIVRPSIIGAAFRDPYAGWVENVTASSAVLLLAGIGMLKFIPGKIEKIGDIIPVDFVADYCVIVGAIQGKSQQLNVFHCSTSNTNPVNWGFIQQTIMLYWLTNVPEKKYSSANLKLIRNQRINNFYLWTRRFPIQLARKTFQLIGQEKTVKQLSRVENMIIKSEQVGLLFSHFVLNEWKFINYKADKMILKLNSEEQKIFLLDTRIIVWADYMLMYHFGLHKYILNENIEPPFSSDMLAKQKISYFSDIEWILQSGQQINFIYLGQNFKTKKATDFRSLILNSTKVQQQIQLLVEKKMVEKSINPKSLEVEKIKQNVNNIVNNICKEMMADYNMSTLRLFGWVLHKIFKQLYENVVVDKETLKLLQNHNSKTQGPLILMPTCRSYIDYVIVPYIFFAYKLQSPHVACPDGFLAIQFLPFIFRRAGAFFTKKHEDMDIIPLQKTILKEYLHRLLIDDCYIEVFLEGQRSKNSSMKKPNPEILNILIDAVLEKKIPDLTIVPITINHEKVVEGDTYPQILMGEETNQESLIKFIKTSKILSQNYGKIYIHLAQPISLKKFIEQSNLPIQQAIQQLPYHIIYTLQDNIVIMTTSMIAAIILMSRKGFMEPILISKVEWLIKEIVKRGSKVSVNEHSNASLLVRNALKLLEPNLLISKKNVFEMSISPSNEYKKILMLSYYRNGLVHVFCLEAICVIALFSFGYKQATQKGVELKTYIAEIQFLYKLLQKEYVTRNTLNTEQDCLNQLQLMSQRGVIQIDNDQAKIKEEKISTFISSLIWPTIESYWISIVYLFTLLKNREHIIQFKNLPQYIQWFGENLYDERTIEHYECCSLDSIRNACQTFKDMDILKCEDHILDNGKKVDQVVRNNVNGEQLTVLEKRVNQFLKRSFLSYLGTSKNSAKDLANRTVYAEFPFMGKL